MAIHPLVLELSVERSDLLDRTLAPCDPELAIDRNERDREGRELERGPEPLRAWSNECHPVRVDERHARILRSADRMGGTIQSHESPSIARRGIEIGRASCRERV